MASSDSEGSTNDIVKETTPPRKRGRPAKVVEKEPELEEIERQLEQDEDDELEPTPKVKRSPGRPKGAKNKTQKEKVESTAPKRPRGRPRKYPPKEKPATTGKRGRPKKVQPVEPVADEEAEES